MSSNPAADGGSEYSWNPHVVESEVEVAEAVRMPHARDADKVMEVLEATGAVALKLDSSWWGNEAFGVWKEWFLVHPDGVSPSGKALFVDKGISLSDPVGHLKTAESRKGVGGWTSKAVRRARSKALKNWGDDYMVGPGGGPGFDDRDVFSDASCPLSAVETAFRLPEPADDLVFPPEGEPREGKLSEGDVRFSAVKQTKYGPKAVLSGDTYDALSSEGDNVADDVSWDVAHLGFDGDEWTCSADGPALWAVIHALNDAEYSVSAPESFAERLQEAKDVSESFGVGN